MMSRAASLAQLARRERERRENAAAAAQASEPIAPQIREHEYMSRETVIVGCKIPNGVMMSCFVMKEAREPVLGMPGQMRVEPKFAKDPTFRDIKLNGPAVPWGIRPDFDIKGGYAFTTVPKAAWEHWTRPGQPGCELVASKMVIGAETRDEAFGMARDYKDLRSGLQPLRQEKDPRVPKPPRPELAHTGFVAEE